MIVKFPAHIYWLIDYLCRMKMLHYKGYSESKKKVTIRNRYNHIAHLTQDTLWESDKITREHQTQESQEVSPFPAGDHKAARNRQTNAKLK